LVSATRSSRIRPASARPWRGAPGRWCDGGDAETIDDLVAQEHALAHRQGRQRLAQRRGQLGTIALLHQRGLGVGGGDELVEDGLLEPGGALLALEDAQHLAHRRHAHPALRSPRPPNSAMAAGRSAAATKNRVRRNLLDLVAVPAGMRMTSATRSTSAK
jgi:hypothetical protein